MAVIVFFVFLILAHLTLNNNKTDDICVEKWDSFGVMQNQVVKNKAFPSFMAYCFLVIAI